ncbi:hypothetical protein NEIMUCOT_04344 [Neisseria mucosa ATCC 25996]|uniref:Uncharacterized protein n=1 Tax=Neisseria mucosa (strain ATCC 25996 / DSM 4631 / NCTC 10774 / M26) TaxID=546266 RepID=D2ZUQ4_NEIM2|nr:hypothetical protein NEIMUCOT_04344 [Neisseria mucosa ATCC 25996]
MKSGCLLAFRRPRNEKRSSENGGMFETQGRIEFVAAIFRAEASA